MASVRLSKVKRPGTFFTPYFRIFRRSIVRILIRSKPMFLFRNPTELFVSETFVKKLQSKHLRINSDIECGRVHVRNTIRVVEYLCVAGYAA